jgi:hypothetical protein
MMFLRRKIACKRMGIRREIADIWVRRKIVCFRMGINKELPSVRLEFLPRDRREVAMQNVERDNMSTDWSIYMETG